MLIIIYLHISLKNNKKIFILIYYLLIIFFKSENIFKGTMGG